MKPLRFQPPSLDSPDVKAFRMTWWHRLPLWAKACLLPVIGGFAGMAALLACLRLTPLPDIGLTSPTRIESADGQTLSVWTLKGTQEDPVALDKMPPFLISATLAVEDANFFRHHAFQPTSIIRALVANARHGHVVEGGSTITQQLAKNLYLTQDRTMMRKIREALYAVQLELHETKDTILNQYLNVVYYGHGAYGVAGAAKLYFNKPVKDLSLAECAFLAGLPKGPSLYSPFAHFTAAKARQRVVLDRMVATGTITRKEAVAAYNEPIHLGSLSRPDDEAPYFTSTAVQEAERQFHLSADDLYHGSMTVQTTLDPLLQHAAEQALADTLPEHSPIQAALVALDPQTGAILAMVGGKDFRSSPYNRAFAERQPGSTFKAILYSAALEKGWTPAREVNSELTTFLYDESKLYTVHDYGDFYAHRPLTLREALAKSDNVYAVTANLETGPANVIDTAHAMGISADFKPYPSLALGVFPASPLQMATAYAVLANGGWYVPARAIDSVHLEQIGRTLHPAVPRQQVLSPQTAFQMTDLLQSVIGPNGTGYAVHNYLQGPVAAKTGTTDTDAWMVGFTPRVVCAVWVGYDDNRPLSLAESHLAAPIWAKFMGTAAQHLPSAWFHAPPGLVRTTIDPATAKLATDACSTTETDYFVAGSEPTESCPLHPASTEHPDASTWLRRWLNMWH